MQTAGKVCMDDLPGFRFFPTEEELVSFYLHNKLDGGRPDLERLLDRVVPMVDIYEFNPWELPRTYLIDRSCIISEPGCCSYRLMDYMCAVIYIYVQSSRGSCATVIPSSGSSSSRCRRAKPEEGGQSG